MIDPYRAAGLERNPFVVDVGAVAPELWLDRGFSDAEVRPRTLVQFLGDKGAGKTSHLRHWQTQLGGDYQHVAPGPARFRIPPLSSPVVYWDEADRIPPAVIVFCLRIMATKEGMVVAGTHRDLARLARWAGLDVTSVRLNTVGGDEVRRWAELRISAVATDERLAREVLGTVPVEDARPTDQTSWREIGDVLHSWAATRVREYSDSILGSGPRRRVDRSAAV